MTSSPTGRGQLLMDFTILLFIVLAGWQILFMMAGSTTISSPWAALQTAAQMIASGDFWINFGSTMRAFVVACTIVILAGSLTGLVLGSFRILGDAYEPMLVSLYTVPKVAFFPVILLIFGIGLSAEVAFGVIHGVIPVAIFATNAVRNLKAVYLRTAKALGLSPTQTAFTVLLPAIAPELFTGIRMGISLTFIGVILSEMFGSHQGVGFLLMQAIGIGHGNQIMALTVLIVSFALTLNAILTAINRRLDHQTSRAMTM